jgi:EAL domain-containing protein (putative c-di-GMP-specific phosphodiesterase class I)/DNA-binding NarL/FixJ family response regulator
MAMPADPQATRIVAIDDDRSMLRLLVRMLAKLGYARVATFTNGEQALAHIRDSVIDLILLDINMPRVDGIEFIRRLTQLEFKGSVILVSGEGERLLEGIDQLLRANGLTTLGWLSKPVETQQLEAVLSKLPPDIQSERGPGAGRRVYDVAQLQRALTHRELVNHYQPIVALGTGELVRVESLVRWQHPQDGLVYPDQFIPLAAQHGLLTSLTRAVLAAAMRDASTWWRADRRLRVSVNVSMDDIACLSFPDEAEALALEHGIDPAAVTMEVTESEMMQALATALDVLNRLRLKRFRLSMDDFGTGHSSLAQLRVLPFDEIKLDRELVTGAAANDRQRAICEAALRMAAQLKLDTVGEGIEDKSDWALLQANGCGLGQGYVIAKPMPATDVIGWLARWEARASAARQPKTAAGS